MIYLCQRRGEESSRALPSVQHQCLPDMSNEPTLCHSVAGPGDPGRGILLQRQLWAGLHRPARSLRPRLRGERDRRRDARPRIGHPVSDVEHDLPAGDLESSTLPLAVFDHRRTAGHRNGRRDVDAADASTGTYRPRDDRGALHRLRRWRTTGYVDHVHSDATGRACPSVEAISPSRPARRRANFTRIS